jgi:diguanylate cyclase (GGDEF)-like protein
MLGALMTKRVFVIMETFQILIVILLMFYYGKNIDEIFLYFIVAISLVIYVYAVVRLNRENGEEAYNNACFMYITSSTDGLSGLLNRRTWYEKSEKIFKLTENISFIMLDIDHFKKINDTYGHDSGDIVIQHISNILLEQTRDDDIVGRLGGEEFGIILKNNEIEDILRIAQRIKDCVQNNIIIHNQNSINVTVSMGVVLKDKNISNFKDFIKKGDINLYKAKESGRNKIIFYQL